MLAESRNIARANTGLKSGVWIEKFPDSQAIPELSDSVVGIIGFGTI
jgi:phosphoglycerate dehydrogenase-like enzyme